MFVQIHKVVKKLFSDQILDKVQTFQTFYVAHVNNVKNHKIRIVNSNQLNYP